MQSNVSDLASFGNLSPLWLAIRADMGKTGAGKLVPC